MNTNAQTQKAHTNTTVTQVRTLNDFRYMVDSMTEDRQLTQGGKQLVNGHEWRFTGDDYRRAWGYLFNRSRQLGLIYCKHFKQFYKPLPPKLAIGDRVRLTSTGATGIVVGHSRFDVIVRIQSECLDAEVSPEFLEVM